MLNWPSKDPNEILDYAIVWSNGGLADDVIVSTTITVIKGNVQVLKHGVHDLGKFKTGQATVTWLAGGTKGMTSVFHIEVLTDQGRKLVETVSIDIEVK